MPTRSWSSTMAASSSAAATPSRWRRTASMPRGVAKVLQPLADRGDERVLGVVDHLLELDHLRGGELDREALLVVDGALPKLARGLDDLDLGLARRAAPTGHQLRRLGPE